MTEQWKYVGNVLLAGSLASAISDEWETTLKAETARIYSALTTKIANETDFQSKIADASSEAFAEFLGTVGGKWDADEIEMKQKVKLYNKYTTWKARIDEVFSGTTPTFPDTVTAKKDRLSELRRVISGVGHKSLGQWEPITMAVLCCRGDTRTQKYMTPANHTFTGTLEACLKAREGALITPALIAEMVYACVLAKYADEGGLTTQRDNIISGSNTKIDALLQYAIDATHLGTGYDVTIVLSWNSTNNMIDVTATDTHP